jgi:phosphoglycolate phosphatase
MAQEFRLDTIKALLFDFEGTLVDFQWKLSAAIEEALETLEKMGFTKDRISSRKYSTLMTEAMQAATEIGLAPEQVREKIGSVYDRYDEDALARWALRPHVKDFLREVRAKGVRTALVSNIGTKTLAAALTKLGLTGFFDVVICRNDVQNPKPDPEMLNLALERLGISKESSMLLGDSLDDVHAAKTAGIGILIISDGENTREDIIAAKPDHLVQGYEELLAACL